MEYHKENFPAVLTSFSIYNGLVLRSRAFLQILSLPVESCGVLLLVWTLTLSYLSLHSTCLTFQRSFTHWNLDPSKTIKCLCWPLKYENALDMLFQWATLLFFKGINWPIEFNYKTQERPFRYHIIQDT